MKDKAFILFNFLIVQFFGLLVTQKFFKREIVIIEGGSNPSTSFYFYLFFVILIASAFVLALIKLNLSKFLYYFVDYFGLFLMNYYVFTFFIGMYLSIAFSFAVVSELLHYNTICWCCFFLRDVFKTSHYSYSNDFTLVL